MAIKSTRETGLSDGRRETWHVSESSSLGSCRRFVPKEKEFYVLDFSELLGGDMTIKNCLYRDALHEQSVLKVLGSQA